MFRFIKYVLGGLITLSILVLAYVWMVFLRFNPLEKLAKLFHFGVRKISSVRPDKSGRNVVPNKSHDVSFSSPLQNIQNPTLSPSAPTV
jgi:hypothetical protein